MSKFLTTCVFTTLFCLEMQANDIVYPDEIKHIYEAADVSIVLSKQSKPIIGIPSDSQVQQIQKDIEKAGGIAIAIPATENAGALRDICARLDGLVLLNGISSDNKFLVLLHKAAIERNLPILGHNAMMEKINQAMLRKPVNITDFPSLISRAQLYKRAHELQSRIFTLDTHSDMPEEYPNGTSVGRRSRTQTSIQKMQEGGLDAIFLVNWQAGKQNGEGENLIDKKKPGRV